MTQLVARATFVMGYVRAFIFDPCQTGKTTTFKIPRGFTWLFVVFTFIKELRHLGSLLLLQKLTSYLIVFHSLEQYTAVTSTS